MKIVDVHTYPVRNTDLDLRPAGASAGAPRGVRAEPIALVIVEVVCDDGTSGIGTVGGFCGAAVPIIRDHLRHVVMGKDPRDVELLWEQMYQASLRYGRRGAAIEAISGIDIALWDVLAKSCHVPVYRLLGGRTRSSVPVYSSHLRDTLPADELTRRARADAEAGFPAVKLFIARGPADGPAGLAAAIRTTRLVREAIGANIDLMVDANCRWDVPFTLQFARATTDLDLRWIEEPISCDDLEGYSRIAAAIDVPIALGEHEFTRFPFVDIISRRCAGVLQPDVNRVGGITEARRIVALAASHSLPVCFHLGWLHSYHLIGAFSNCPIGEYLPPPDPAAPPGNTLNWLVIRGEPRAEQGRIVLDELPGFGWEIDREQLSLLAPAQNGW